MPWVKRSGVSTEETWKPEKEGDAIEGILREKKENVGPNESMLYVLEKKDGKNVGVWGATALDNQMGVYEIGEKIRIEFLGMKHNPKTGRDFKNWDVSVWSELYVAP